MNSRKIENMILDTTVKSNVLETIADINQNATTSKSSIPRSKLLLVTLTTTIMMACDKPLSKEYYQYTRAYLETIKKDDGTSLPNISGLLKFIEKFEKKHNIDDTMQTTKIEMPAEENIEVDTLQLNEDLNKSQDEHPFSSTKNNEDDEQENDKTNIEADAEEKLPENENVEK